MSKEEIARGLYRMYGRVKWYPTTYLPLYNSGEDIITYCPLNRGEIVYLDNGKLYVNRDVYKDETKGPVPYNHLPITATIVAIVEKGLDAEGNVVKCKYYLVNKKVKDIVDEDISFITKLMIYS